LANDPDNASPFDDASAQAGKTYAYRVMAWRGAARSTLSEPDLATMLNFSPVVIGGKVYSSHLTELLLAVNAMRAVSGWAAVTWNNILSAQDPAPLIGEDILGRHLVALRMRMNEAIQAVGVRTGTYTDPDPRIAKIKAVHITELQARTQ
jgi:hypothetical protein